jgi:hypothetical protein
VEQVTADLLAIDVSAEMEFLYGLHEKGNLTEEDFDQKRE